MFLVVGSTWTNLHGRHGAYQGPSKAYNQSALNDSSSHNYGLEWIITSNKQNIQLNIYYDGEKINSFDNTQEENPKNLEDYMDIINGIPSHSIVLDADNLGSNPYSMTVSNLKVFTVAGTPVPPSPPQTCSIPSDSDITNSQFDPLSNKVSFNIHTNQPNVIGIMVKGWLDQKVINDSGTVKSLDFQDYPSDTSTNKYVYNVHYKCSNGEITPPKQITVIRPSKECQAPDATQIQYQFMPNNKLNVSVFKTSPNVKGLEVYDWNQTKLQLQSTPCTNSTCSFTDSLKDTSRSEYVYYIKNLCSNKASALTKFTAIK